MHGVLVLFFCSEIFDPKSSPMFCVPTNKRVNQIFIFTFGTNLYYRYALYLRTGKLVESQIGFSLLLRDF